LVTPGAYESSADRGIVDAELSPLGKEAVDPAESESTRASVVVATLLAHPSLPIGEVLPALRALGDEPISPAVVDRRSLTTLTRLGCTTWSDLAAKTVEDILAVPSAGQRTVSRLLLAAEARNGGPSRQSSPISVAEPDGTSELRLLVAELASWAIDARAARTLGDVLGLSANLGWIPAEIQARFAALTTASLDVFVDAASLTPAASAPQLFLDAIGDRSDLFVRRRLVRDGRPTLQQLGNELGISRERVRQLESGAVDRALHLVATSEFRHLRWRAGELAAVLGPAVPVASDVLEDALQWACRGLDDPESCTARDLLLWLAGPYELDPAGWLVGPNLSMKTLLDEFQARVGDQWLLSRASVAELISLVELSPTLVEPFLSAAGRWRSIGDDWWVRWDGAVGEKAEIVLLLTMHPMTAEEINSAIGEAHSTTSVRNALAAESRFVRLDKTGTYGLTEWGLEEYSGIAQEILERIERSGGSAPLEQLVREFVDQFGVSETSVRMYAASPAFVVSDGLVRRREASEAYQPDERIERVRGSYVRSDGAVLLQVPIDRDVLRGSGRQLAEPVAALLGMRPGSRVEFVASGGSRVLLTWPETSVMGPSLGSVRNLASDLGLELGDRMVLAFHAASSTVEASPVQDGSLSSLTGLALEHGREVEQLATSIRVRPMDVRAALHARGDHEVLALLPSPASTDDLSDAIDEFGDLLG
jgi:hypothetical protein